MLKSKQIIKNKPSNQWNKLWILFYNNLFSQTVNLIGQGVSINTFLNSRLMLLLHPLKYSNFKPVKVNSNYPLKLNVFHTDPFHKPSAVLKSDQLSLEYKPLFNKYLTLANTVGDLDYRIHSSLREFFIIEGGLSKLNYLNLTKVFQKWTHSYKFLFNLFYYKSTLLLFSTKVLKVETLAFNWLQLSTHYNIFKYSQTFFFFKNNPYGDRTSYVFEKLSTMGIETSFVSDIRSHYKTLAFLRRYNIYTIGLVSYNINPWVVNYPIVVSSSNLITQYFFIKLLTYINQQANVKYLSYYHN